MTRRDWDIAVRDFCAYLAASGASDQTQRLRRKYLIRFANETALSPWLVTTDDLLRFLSNPSWSPETRKSARSTLRAFYGWAVVAGRIDQDPSRVLPPIRIPPTVPRPAPIRMVNTALKDADDRIRLMVLLAMLAGLRRSEIAGLHTDDVMDDLLGLSLRVRGKGGRVRLVPLHPVLVRLLPRHPPGFVFPGRIDGHLSANHVGTLLSRCLGRGWSGHTLRHRFATDVYAVDRDLRAVQLLLGHSRPETTARYTQVPQDAMRSAVMALHGVA